MLIPQHLDALLSQPFDQATFLTAQKAFYDWLAESFDRYPVIQLVQARAAFTDRLLGRLWAHFELDKERNATLIAVGGYGRGELHPYSDIDLLILTNNTSLPRSSITKIENLISTLWDLKLDIGHSVRTIDDTLFKAQQDVTLATSLLEMRWLSGVKSYYQTLKKRLKETPPWSSGDFFVAKRTEQFQRHHKYNGITYTLEPNLKANPGSLRDIQSIDWIAKYHIDYGNGKKRVNNDYLTEEERLELIESQDLLWTMRFALHLEVGRGENRLLFDHQAVVAKRLGFGDLGKVSVERMMKRLFRVMRRVLELNEMLLHHYQLEILGDSGEHHIEYLDDNFQLNDRLIQGRHSNVFLQRHNILQLFVHIAQNGQIEGIHSTTIRQLRRFRHRALGDLQDYEACQKHFIRIFKHPNGVAKAAMLMHKHGILGAYLPWWRQIVGQMQFDLFHAYTVDEHTIKVLQNCSRFFGKQNSKEFPLCHEIAIRIDKPELLFLAAVFHDIAKGRGGRHSELGGVDVKEFSRVHQLSQYDEQLLVWLVRNHLLLSSTAQRRDINDPQIIKDFSKQMRDEVRLDYLYCLTVADVCATNDNLWNSWKASLFQDLYLFSQKALRHGLEKPLDIRATIKDRRADAKARLLTQFDEAQIDALWSHFQTNYFALYGAEQISWHSGAILSQPDIRQPLIQVRQQPFRGGTPIFVYYPLQPDMFIQVVSALDDKRLNILDAQLVRNKEGYAMNTFIVLEKDSKPISGDKRATAIERALQMSLQSERRKRYRSKRMSNKIKHFNVKPRVEFIPGNNKNTSTIELVALDTPGLLVQIGQIFKQCQLSIHSAKITTIGEKAEDMFVLSNQENQALTVAQQDHLRAVLSQDLSEKAD